MFRSDAFQFLKAFLRSPSSVGAVVPSSAALAEAMLRGIKLAPDECIVEFGSGTGSFTRAIRKKLAFSAQYLGIERDPRLVMLLRQRFPELSFVEGSAENVLQHLAAYREKCEIRGLCRAILSGLPFASLPESVHEGVFTALDVLIVDGVQFRTFQYVHSLGLPKAMRFRERMNARFGQCKMQKAVPWNFPPAVVLCWEG